MQNQFNHYPVEILEEAALHAALDHATLDNNPEPWKKVYNTLQSEDFFTGLHRTCFEMLCKIQEKHKHINHVLFFDCHTNQSKTNIPWNSYIISPLEAPISEFFADDIILILRERRIKREIRDSHNLFESNKIDREEFHGKIKEIKSLAITRDHIKTINDSIEEYYENFAEIKELLESGNSAVIESEFKIFNEECPLVRGELTTIAARTGIGKSMFGLNLGLGVARNGFDVVYISVEMPEKQMFDRIFARETKVRIKQFQLGKYDADSFGKISDKIIKTYKTFRFLYAPHISSEEIKLLLRELDNVDLLIVDYMQILKDPLLRNETNATRVSKISGNLKQVAGDQNCATIGISQVNREASKKANKMPDLENLRDSGAIEQDSDKVLFLNRDKEDDPKNMVLQIAKNRTGREHLKIKYIVDLEIANITEI